MFQDRQQELIEAAETNDLHKMLTTLKRAKAAAK